MATSPELGESLSSTVVLRTDRATEFPLIRLRALRLLVNGQESTPIRTELMETVRFKYLIMGDSSYATSVRVEGRVASGGVWHTVAVEDPSQIESSGTVSFIPRIKGEFDFRVVVQHKGRVYTSESQRLIAELPSADSDSIKNDLGVQQAMVTAWEDTKKFAYDHRADGTRKEVGFAIYFNTGTGNYEVGPRFEEKQVAPGQQASVEVSADEDRFIDASSPNGHMVYLVSLFHTHTPMTFMPSRRGGQSRIVGPSDETNDGRDHSVIRKYSAMYGRQIVGLVYDYVGDDEGRINNDIYTLDFSRGFPLWTLVKPAHGLHDPARVYVFF